MASHSLSKSRVLSVPVALHPLTEKHFGFFWAGAFLSSIGFWIQTVGQGWQVLQLTNSPLLLGFVTFAATLPNILFSLFGGVIADRLNRRYLLIGTQAIYMSTATILGILTTLHVIAVWHIILFALINGLFSSVGFPAWQAFIGDLVPSDELKQGIALNSMQFNMSRMVGPAIGGLSIGIFGIAGSYYLNAASYLAVLFPLVLMHPVIKVRKSERESIWRGLGGGLSYVRKRPFIQVLLLLQFSIAFLVFPYATLLPVFARDIFHIGAPGLGLLNAMSGLGALGGSLTLVMLSQRMQRGGRVLLLLTGAGGLACLAFSFMPVVSLSLLLLIVLGGCTVMSMTVTNTTLQLSAPEELRGRVLSIWVLVGSGLAPFGNLVAGWIAQSTGAPVTLALGGSLCALTAVVVWMSYKM